MAFIGEIRANAGNSTPLGWLVCNGQMLTPDAWPELFAAIGYKYGGNAESGLFAVPDCNGRFLRGDSDIQPSLGGSSTVTLTTNNLPSHSHAISVAVTVGTGVNGGIAASNGSYLTSTAGGTQTAAAVYAPSATNPVQLGGVAASLANTGCGTPFDIIPPFVGVTYIICAALA